MGLWLSFEGGVLEDGVMFLDWDNKGGFSCCEVVIISKKFKKGDFSFEK